LALRFTEEQYAEMLQAAGCDTQYQRPRQPGGKVVEFRRSMDRVRNLPSRAYQRVRGGRRDDLPWAVASGWEANVARVLFLLVEKGEIARFEYEPEEIDFGDGYRKNRYYIPDFRTRSIVPKSSGRPCSLSRKTPRHIGGYGHLVLSAFGFMASSSKSSVGSSHGKEGKQGSRVS